MVMSEGMGRHQKRDRIEGGTPEHQLGTGRMRKSHGTLGRQVVPSRLEARARKEVSKMAKSKNYCEIASYIGYNFTSLKNHWAVN